MISQNGRSFERHLKYFDLVDDGRKAITFGMGNNGVGQRWLAEACHQSAFRHWQTAATATPVQHQGHAIGKEEGFG